MYRYYFILGQNKNLSIVEILNKSEIKRLNLNSEDVILMDGVLLIEAKEEIDAKALLNELGGTIKIGKIHKTLNDLNKIKVEEVMPLMKVEEGKINFGISIVNFTNHKFVKNLAISIKKGFRSEGINSRWVESKEGELSSVLVGKNKLTEKGGEIYIIRDKNEFLIGTTLANQDFESYSNRDFGRPKRDVESGMIPPKLAQIMINLAGIDKNGQYLDPFCGSGTFLQEAILMGYKNIIGADFSKKAISDTEENLGWLENEYKLENMDFKLLNLDVSELSKELQPNSIDGIATEPYLGPTRLTCKTRQEASALLKELNGLYMAAFKEFSKIVKSGGRVVIILPVINIGKKDDFVYLDILQKVNNLGFNIIPFVSGKFKDLIQITFRKSLLYARTTPNQRIVREIFVFEKK